MSGKLDQSLDEILTTQRGGGRGRGGRRGRGRAAPVGGIKKSVRVAAKATAKAAPATAKTQATKVAATGATKIIVSNLPNDVTESQIKEYFSKSAGPIKRVNLTYGPSGNSKGIATIIFLKPSSGAKALEANGTKVDNKPMKIEAVFDPSHIPSAESKSLSDRVTGNKAKVDPRQAKGTAKPVKAEPAARGARGRGRGTTRGAARGGRAARGKPKTADELDAEMTDYFTTTAGETAPATNGTAPAPAPAAAGGDDTGMDEVS